MDKAETAKIAIKTVEGIAISAEVDGKTKDYVISLLERNDIASGIEADDPRLDGSYFWYRKTASGNYQFVYTNRY